MDIIIKTGFGKIQHAIDFQPQSIPKEKALVESHHVLNVEELRKNGQSYLICAWVIRQASVTEKLYAVRLFIDDKRFLTDAICSCAYKENERKCKHVAALVYFINNEENLSKTDVEQKWGKPSARQLVKETHLKGKFIHEIRKKGNKPKSIPKKCDEVDRILKLKNNSPLKTMCQNLHSEESDLLIEDRFIVDTLASVEKVEECRFCVENFFLCSANLLIYSSTYKLPDYLEDFYKKEIVMSCEDILKLSCDTLDQAGGKEWFLERKKRISASKSVHSIKTRKTKTIEKLKSEIFNDNVFSSKATEYGVLNEQNARESYKKTYKVDIYQVGLVVSNAQSSLCASLDGVVVQNSIIKKIVEIKCPESCKDKPIVDGNIINVKYLESNNGHISLKETSIYYSQCQTQLCISGQQICDLYLWSSQGSYCVTVYRNESFIKKAVLASNNFYFNHYLPEVYQKMNEKIKNERQFTGLDISNQVVNL